MKLKELTAGREYYLTAMMPENHEANRLTMLNIFNTSCYGPLQTIFTNYFAEIDNIGFVKDYNGVCRCDKIDFELLWTLIFLSIQEQMHSRTKTIRPCPPDY
jgi:hypothetical protein